MQIRPHQVAFYTNKLSPCSRCSSRGTCFVVVKDTQSPVLINIEAGALEFISLLKTERVSSRRPDFTLTAKYQCSLSRQCWELYGSVLDGYTHLTQLWSTHTYCTSKRTSSWQLTGPLEINNGCCPNGSAIHSPWGLMLYINDWCLVQ